MPEARIIGPDAGVSSSMPAVRRRCRIFVSYAHQDAKRKDDLEQREHGLISRYELELKKLLLGEGEISGDPQPFHLADFRISCRQRWLGRRSPSS